MTVPSEFQEPAPGGASPNTTVQARDHATAQAAAAFTQSSSSAISESSALTAACPTFVRQLTLNDGPPGELRRKKRHPFSWLPAITVAAAEGPAVDDT